MQRPETYWRKDGKDLSSELSTEKQQKIQDNDKKLLNIFRFGICPLRVASFAV